MKYTATPKIRQAREALGLSQRLLAVRMQQQGFKNWGQVTVSQAERGKKKLSEDELLGLSKALDLPATKEIEVPVVLKPVEVAKKIRKATTTKAVRPATEAQNGPTNGRGKIPASTLTSVIEALNAAEQELTGYASLKWAGVLLAVDDAKGQERTVQAYWNGHQWEIEL